MRSLREHHKIKGQDSDVMEGDIVLIKRENQPRNSWKLGKITRLIKGSDDVVRGVRLQTMTNGVVTFLERPMQLLYPMELQVQPEITHDGGNAEKSEEVAVEHARPRRKAARQASEAWKTQLMLEDDDENQIGI